MQTMAIRLFNHFEYSIVKIMDSLIEFLPYIPIAQEYLIRRGVEPSSDPRILADQVFEEGLKRNFGFEGELDEFTDTVIEIPQSFGMSDKGLDFLAKGGKAVEVLKNPAVIQLTTNIFSGIKNKIQKRKNLSQSEKKIVPLIPKIEENIQKVKKIQSPPPPPVKEKPAINYMIPVAALLLVVIFIFLMRR